MFLFKRKQLVSEYTVFISYSLQSYTVQWQKEKKNEKGFFFLSDLCGQVFLQVALACIILK